MKIAIDIDEVIVEFVEKYLEFVESRGVRRVDYEDVFCYELWEVLGIEKDLVVKLFDEYNFTEYFKKHDFVEGAREGVVFLRDNHDICFITARPKDRIKETKDFIMNEFGVLGDRVLFSGDIIREGKNKDEICRELGVGVIIEDNGSSSLEYAENGLRVLLLDKPWNRRVEHERIYRCFSWDDVLDKIKEIEDGE